MDASTSHILTRFNSRKNCLIFGNWIFHENIAKISSNWGILLIQNNRFFGFKKPVFGYLKLAKITGFPRPVKTGVSTLCRAGLLHKFPTFNLPLFKFLFIVVFIQVSFAGFFIFGTPQKVTEKLLLLMKKSWVPFLKEIFGLSGNSCTVSDGSGWCKSDSKSFLLNASTKRSAAASEDEDPRLVKTSSSSMTSYFGPYSPPGAKIGQSYRKNNMF